MSFNSLTNARPCIPSVFPQAGRASSPPIGTSSITHRFLSEYACPGDFGTSVSYINEVPLPPL